MVLPIHVQNEINSLRYERDYARAEAKDYKKRHKQHMDAYAQSQRIETSHYNNALKEKQRADNLDRENQILRSRFQDFQALQDKHNELVAKSKQTVQKHNIEVASLRNLLRQEEQTVHRQDATIRQLNAQIAQLENDKEALKDDLVEQEQLHQQLIGQWGELAQSFGFQFMPGQSVIDQWQQVLGTYAKTKTKLADTEQTVKKQEDYIREQILLPRAQRGDVEAQFTLAQMYHSGEGAKQDQNKAIQWYSAAGVQNHPESLYQLGRIYEAQRSAKIPHQNFYQKAADLGHMEAQYKYGTHLFRRSELIAARRYSKMAMNQGHKDATALYANLHYTLTVKELEVQKARYKDRSTLDRAYVFIISDLTEAAELGQADAQFLLAQIMDKGLAGDKDIKTAKKWYEKAANQGHPEACYEHYKNTSKNDPVIGYLQKAADAGITEAEAEYGSHHLRNKKDFSSAVQYLSRAAEKDDSSAIIALAKLYVDWSKNRMSRPEFVFLFVSEEDIKKNRRQLETILENKRSEESSSQILQIKPKGMDADDISYLLAQSCFIFPKEDEKGKRILLQLISMEPTKHKYKALLAEETYQITSTALSLKVLEDYFTLTHKPKALKGIGISALEDLATRGKIATALTSNNPSFSLTRLFYAENAAKDVGSALNLASMERFGLGGEKSSQNARDTYNRVAKEGTNTAHTKLAKQNLAEMMENGEGGPQDLKAAQKIYKEIGEQESARRARKARGWRGFIPF